MLLVLSNLILLFSICCLEITARSQFAATPAFRLQLQQEMEGETAGEMQQERISKSGKMDRAQSGRRVIGYQILKQQGIILTEEEFQILCRIVEAEAGGEDINGRLLVANVILNRVEDEDFPDTVKAVVFEKHNGSFQFSPVHDGRYEKVSISKETKEAVERALLGEDNSKGALYFAARKAADPEKMKWFDTHLTRLFAYGGHEFFS